MSQPASLVLPDVPAADPLAADPLAADPLAADPLAHNPLLARAALRRHLLVPDGSALLSDAGAPAEPAALAGSLAVGLLGGGAFGLVLAIATGGGAGGLSTAPTLLGSLLAAGLLTFPPLYLLHALRRRDGGVHHLAAAAVVGPAVCGAWLGAASPLLLLYALTGTVGASFGLLALLLLLMAFTAGGVAARRRAARVGSAGPGQLAVLAHYALTTWTAVVLAAHLS